MSLTLAGIIRHQAVMRPSHVAMTWDSGSMTYGQLDDASSRLAQALLASGVTAGDRVAMLDKNGPEQLELIFGAAKLGAIPAPVSFGLSPSEVRAVLAESTPSVWVVGAEFASLAGAAPDGTQVVVIGDAPIDGEGDPGVSFAAWRDDHPAVDPHVPQTPDDVAFLLFSSGTTGVPKGVMIFNANLASSFTVYRQLMGLDEHAVSLVPLPLFHIGGSGWALVGCIEGATNVVVRDIVPSRLVELLEREAVTHAAQVAAVLQFMLQVPGVEQRDFSALRAVLYGAAPISEQLLRDSLRVFGSDFFQAYGLSETTGTTVLLPPGDHDPGGPLQHRLRSAGRPMPGHEARVVDPLTGGTTPTGEVGEIQLKGPNVMKGYWNRPEDLAATVVDGWLRTGDAGYVDDDGYLYVHDRVKDMIVSGGENIYSIEIEHPLASHPAVADVAVIAVPSERWGETPRAVVVRAPGGEVTDDELIAHCRQRRAGFKCPTSIEWVGELPRSAAGKVLKKHLRAPHWAGRARAVG